MKDLFIIIILVIVGSLLVISISFSQNGLNIQAYVPETPYNTNLPEKTQTQNISEKENKYLQFFEKALNIRQEKEEKGSALPAQTSQDKYASYGLMISLLIFTAIILLIIVRLIDNYIIVKFFKKSKKYT